MDWERNRGRVGNAEGRGGVRVADNIKGQES
jgi:hypothetical protein